MSNYGIKACDVYDILSVEYHKIFIDKVTKKFVDVSFWNYEGDLVHNNKRCKVNMKYLKNNQIPYIKFNDEIINLDFPIENCNKSTIEI